MKAILMSIRPKWVAKILNGEKTIEIRKKFPKDYAGWVYIYCTKDKKYANLINRGGFLTGMVVARFWCDKVEEIKQIETIYGYKRPLGEYLKESCLSFEELHNYLKSKSGYAINITKLEIFEKPKEISEFKVQFNYKKYDCEKCPNQPWTKCTQSCEEQKVSLTRAPQSWCYTEI